MNQMRAETTVLKTLHYKGVYTSNVLAIRRIHLSVNKVFLKQ